jgi:iron complex outermembrane receptor protein
LVNKTIKTCAPLPRLRLHQSMVSSTATGCALLLLAAGVSRAQQAPPPSQGTAPSDQELQEVVVTGIQQAIDTAIGVKRNSDDIVESISAEDIGKLPDTSIAESISRLPGLTSQRSDGRASDISIRGTDPQFAGSLLNGREQVSTGDNRAIEYDQYPSELVSAVVVYKTPDAGLIGQGLAGTIALQTTRPLEYGHMAFAVNARKEYNSDASLGSDSNNHGYRWSASYIDQFFDNTLGVTLGFAALDSPIVGREFGMYTPWAQNGTEHAGVPADVYVSGGIKSLASSGINRRNGTIGTVEWKPNSEFTSTLDLFYTTADAANNRRSMEVNLGNYPNTAHFSDLDVEDGVLVGATVSNLVPLARNFFYDTRDEIFQAGWNNKWVTGPWTFTSDIAASKAQRIEHDYETQAQYWNGTTDTATYFFPGGSSQPTFNLLNSYTNPALVKVGPTIYGAGYSRFPIVSDQLQSYRFEALREAGGPFRDVAVGFNYDDRTKDKTQPEANLSTIGNAIDAIPGNLLLPPANLSFSGTPSSLAWNVPAVLGEFFNPIQPTTLAGYLVGKTWQVYEKVPTLYVRGDLNQPLLANVTLRGNVGVQLVHTEQSSDSKTWGTNNEAYPFSGGKSFNDVLPAVNLVFDLADQQSVRLSLARELARARMDQLAANNDFSVATTTGIPYDTAGNPRLDPWRADAVDLSYEKYFLANKAYVSFAGFYKNLRSYIYDQTEAANLSQFEVGLPPAAVPTLQNGFITYPLNGNGGKLEGLELAISGSFDLLSDALQGFGANASVSQTSSSIKIAGTASGVASADIPLPGLSKTVWSAMLYYERYGFSARIATRYRSNYIGEIDDFAGDRQLEFIRHEQITDFQTSYEFKQGPVKGLMILFQINNLTDTPFIDYSGNPAALRDYEKFGRDMFFGLNYKIG